MRSSLFFLAAVALFIACDDNAQTTAPRSATLTPSSPSSAAQSEYPPGPGRGVRSAGLIQSTTGPIALFASPPGPGQNLKPAASFTTVVATTSPEVQDLDGIVFPTYAVQIGCLPGARAIGGGYEITKGINDARVMYNAPYGADSWRVVMTTANQSPVWFKVTAICIQ